MALVTAMALRDRGEPLPRDTVLISPALDVRFSGTRDILNPDARALVSAATRVGVEVSYYETPDMIHIYPLLPLPEAKFARQVIKEILAQHR